MPPFLFRAVDIYIFDLHVAPGPLLQKNTEALRSDFRFLIDPAKYNKLYESHVKLDTERFHISPLSHRTLERNHFWRYYKGIWLKKGRPDSWKLQLPFVCVPKGHEFRVADASIHRSVRAKVYLWGWGWSSNLRIRVKGELEPDRLIDFVTSLREADATPLLINGSPASTLSLLKLCSQAISRELSPGDNSIEHILKVPRGGVPLDVENRKQRPSGS